MKSVKKMLSKSKIIGAITIIFIMGTISACGETSEYNKESEIPVEEVAIAQRTKSHEDAEDIVNAEGLPQEEDLNTEDSTSIGSDSTEEPQSIAKNGNTMEYNGVSYNIIEVDGGNQSGYRESNVAVDIGYGDREYWAFTNEYGQLVYVVADRIILQDDASEPVNSNGRYYNDEAKVPGVESDSLDEGHVIADSLGGVSNAYSITPQNSTLNRHGDQAYMEKVIRDAGGCEKFVATITYPDTATQIPSHYHFEYVLNGESVVDDFDNVNPDEVNRTMESQVTESIAVEEPAPATNNDLSSVDTNRDGQVTIKEAKAAGYSMPIYSDHWLYQYMNDGDGDGMVGE